MDEKQQIIDRDLEALGQHLFDAHGHAEATSSAIQTAAHLAERARRGTDPTTAAALARAMGGVLAEQASLRRALEGAMDHFERLPIRLDVAAAEAA